MNPQRNRILAVAATLAIAVAVLRIDFSGEDARPRHETTPPQPPVAATPDAARAAATAASVVRSRDGDETTPPLANRAQRATVEVRVHFAVGGVHRTTTLRAVSESTGRVVGETLCTSEGLEAIASLDVRPGQWTHIEAVVDGVHVPGRRLQLGAGERHPIDLHYGPRVTRLQVRGPSRELARHLRLEVVDRGAEPPTPFRVPLAGDGSVRCAFSGSGSAWVVLSGKTRPAELVPLQTAAGGFEFDPSMATIDLVPDQPLLGIAAHDAGRPVAALVWLDSEPLALEPTLCNVTTRRAAAAATTIHCATDRDAPKHRGSLAQLSRLADLWTIQLGDLDPLGELRVTLAPAPATTRTAALYAEPWDGGVSVRLRDSAAARSTDLPPGDYRLTWAFAGSTPETAVEHIRITAGQRTEVEIAPRGLEDWTFELVDAPAGLPLALRVGEHLVAHGSDGTLAGALASAPGVNQPAQIILPQEKAAFAAEFTAVDTATRRATLSSALADAVRTRLTPNALADRGAARIWLLPMPELPIAGGWFFFADSAHVLPGQRRPGYVTETIDGGDHLTCWFEIVGGATEVQPTPAGRWATLVLPRAPSRADVFCESRLGRSGRLRFSTHQTATPIYVADGTTAIHVEFEGVRRTFDSRLTEFVVH